MSRNWHEILLFLSAFIALTHSLNVSTVGQIDVMDLKQKVKILEQRLQALEAMNNPSDKAIQQVGFTACLSSPSAVSIGYHQPIEFDNVITNDGNGFDPRHGLFRAPFSGLYHFSMTIYSMASHLINIQMVRDGTEISRTFEGGNDYLSSTANVTVGLSAGQDVWCRNSQSSKALINSDNYSCFSGHLISS